MFGQRTSFEHLSSNTKGFKHNEICCSNGVYGKNTTSELDGLACTSFEDIGYQMSDKNAIYCIELNEYDGDFETWRICYIGETGRGDVQRFLEHKGLVGGASRVAASMAKHGRASHRVRILDVVDDVDDRKALETYLMQKFNTLIENVTKMRNLLAHENRSFDHLHPDISLDGKPRNFQLNQIRSVADQAKVEAAGKAYETRAAGSVISYTKEDEERMFEAIDVDLTLNEDVEEPLTRVLVAVESAKPTSEQIVFEIDSAFMQARMLRVKYDEMTPSDVIYGNDSFDDLTLVLNFIDKDTDEALYKHVFQIYKMLHPDKRPSASARTMFHIFGAIEQYVGEVEEAAIVEQAKGDKGIKKNMDQAVKWLEWMGANYGRTPTHTPVAKGSQSLDETKREKSLGEQMMVWRSGNHGYYPKQQQRNLYLVILRDFEAFANFCYGRYARSDDTAENLNKLLLKGYGMKKEMKDHPNLKQLQATCTACGHHTKEYIMWQHFLDGQNAKNSDTLLAGLPAERVKTAKAMHDGKETVAKEKKAESNKKRDQAWHAAGLVKPQKKKAKPTPYFMFGIPTATASVSASVASSSTNPRPVDSDSDNS